MDEYSDPSTACSTPTNDSVKKILKNDTVRYRRKGYGLIFATIIAFTFFYYFPKLFKLFLPFLNSTLSKEGQNFVLGFAVHTGVYLIANSLMYFIYNSKFEFFERYKVLSNPWPWESDPQQWRKLLKSTLKTTLIIHFFIMPLLFFADCAFGVQFRTDLETFPGYSEMIPQIIFFMLCDDCLFYWFHRILHHPWLYARLHKYHHEYHVTVSIAFEYSHPIDFLFGSVIPYAAGAKILGNRVHLVTYMMWGIMRVMETVDGHSGYEFSWSPYRLLPFSGSSSYHNFHHLQNVGNYGSFFTLWDTLCGTNKAYFKFIAKKEKQEIVEKIKEERRMKEKKMSDDYSSNTEEQELKEEYCRENNGIANSGKRSHEDKVKTM